MRTNELWFRVRAVSVYKGPAPKIVHSSGVRTVQTMKDKHGFKVPVYQPYNASQIGRIVIDESVFCSAERDAHITRAMCEYAARRITERQDLLADDPEAQSIEDQILNGWKGKPATKQDLLPGDYGWRAFPKLKGSKGGGMSKPKPIGKGLFNDQKNIPLNELHRTIKGEDDPDFDVEGPELSTEKVKREHKPRAKRVSWYGLWTALVREILGGFKPEVPMTQAAPQDPDDDEDVEGCGARPVKPLRKCRIDINRVESVKVEHGEKPDVRVPAVCRIVGKPNKSEDQKHEAIGHYDQSAWVKQLKGISEATYGPEQKVKTHFRTIVNGKGIRFIPVRRKATA